MKQHRVKCWPEHFQAVWDGLKKAELRLNDRDYQTGDELVLLEYNPVDDSYSERQIRADISHVLAGGPWLAEGYAMLSLLDPRNYVRGPSGQLVAPPADF